MSLWKITYENGQTEQTNATDLRALLTLVPDSPKGPFYPAFSKGHPDDVVCVQRVND